MAEPSAVTGTPSSSTAWHLWVLSADTESELETAAAGLVDELHGQPQRDAGEVAHMLQLERPARPHRRVLVCRDTHDGAAALQARDPKRVFTAVVDAPDRPVVFMFPGLGNHYVNMGRGIYDTEPVFRRHLDRCAELCEAHLDVDLRNILYSDAGATRSNASTASGLDLRRMLRGHEQSQEQAVGLLQQTCLAQPAVFAVEYALAKLWMAWGIRPCAILGYSVGEYVAACLAGVTALEDALTLICQRARLIDDLPGGAMLAVPLSEQDVQPLLGPEVFLTAVNGPASSVLAGATHAIDTLQKKLTQQDIVCLRLPTSHAFHTPMMGPITGPLTDLASRINHNPPAIPFFSNVTGTWIDPARATDPRYWATHTCEPVRFADSVRQLAEHPDWALLEVGPGNALRSFVMQHPRIDARTRHVLWSLRHVYERQTDAERLLTTLGKLWLAGVSVDWAALRSR